MFSQALLAYTKATPGTTFVQVEEALRGDGLTTFLIAKAGLDNTLLVCYLIDMSVGASHFRHAHHNQLAGQDRLPIRGQFSILTARDSAQICRRLAQLT